MYLNKDNVAYTANVIPDCFQNNVQYTPLDGVPGEDRSEESNAKACQARCQNVEGCAYFSFWKNSGCHLQSSTATARSVKASVVAGPKRCTDGNDNICIYINIHTYIHIIPEYHIDTSW